MQKDERPNRLGLVLAIALVVLLALPALRLATIRAPDGALYGYTDEIAPHPSWRWTSFEDKSLQRWVEKFADIHMGFRAVLVRSFNEVNFRLFGEAPKLQLYGTTTHGLYSKMSLDALHEQVSRRATLEPAYRAEAQKLLRIQRLLEAQGKSFQVVIAASKPYVYPQGLGARRFRGEASDPLEGAANFAEALRLAGVSVIDGDRVLRDFVARTGIETHADSGVHWNYYAGCLVATRLIEEARRQARIDPPPLDCGLPRQAEPKLVDLDGWSLLNIWSDAGLRKPTNYPTFASNPDKRASTRFLFVSDSFVDQITYSLQEAHAYSRLVTSNYFKLRHVDDATTPGVPSSKPVDEAGIRRAILDDVASSDVIVLELVDYNTWRLSYGFADYLLEHLPSLEKIALGPAIGAYDRESDGTNSWNWIGNTIRFHLSPTFVPSNRTGVRLRFEYVTRGKQTLSGRVTSSDGLERRFTVESRGDHLDPFEATIDLPADRLAELTITSDGKAVPLNASDPRSASWMLRNVVIDPVQASR